MRHTIVTALTVLLVASAIVYAAWVVSGDLRQVAEQLEVVSRDMRAMGDDIRSIADDVNAIATTLAGEDDNDEQQQTPVVGAALRVSRPSRRVLARRAHGLGASATRRHVAIRHTAAE